MTRESKAGLLMILMLFSIFGFMVYKRLHQPAQALAQQDTFPTGTGREKDAGPSDVFEQTSPAANPAAGFPDDFALRQGASNDSTDNDRGRSRQSRSDSDPFSGISLPESTAKPKASTPLPDDLDDQFRRPPAKSKVVQKPTRVQPSGREVVAAKAAVEEDNPFEKMPPKRTAEERREQDTFDSPAARAVDRFEDEVAKNPKANSKPPQRLDPPGSDVFDVQDDRRPRRDEQRANPDVNEFSGRDGFETPIPTQPNRIEISKQPSKRRGSTAVVQAAAEDASFNDSSNDDPFGSPQEKAPAAVDRVRSDRDDFSNPRERVRTADAQPAFPSSGAESPRRINRPAPVPQIDEDFTPRATEQSLVPGEQYKVEPSDNFWVISRKKYGTGRYFMALAQHNLQVIPDPKMMKPGVTISTPSAQALERAYPNLISKPDTQSGIGPIQTASTASVSLSAETPGGFFVSSEGTPMYRVGKEDTLSDIAQRHLGRSSRWIQVYHLNRDVLTDGNTLKIGMQLRLPADASRVEVVGNSRTFR